MALKASIICSMIMIMLTTIKAQSTPNHPLPPFSCDPTANPSTKSYPFCNIRLPIRERARDLVTRLTLDEKISQLINHAVAIPRLGIPFYNWWVEGLHGVAKSSGIKFGNTIKTATSFPQVILTAASFDEQLWYRIGQVIGREARAIYNEGEAVGLTFWTPNINIFRDPRWGRGQETPGEDPFLTSRYAVSLVRGLQGDTFEGGQLLNGHLQASACCKHFTAYDLENWNGNHRFTFNARVTKQDMADTFQPPFRSCVKDAKASGVMCAYNRVNGVPACADYNLLTKTARGEWGFDGYIVSDCDAVGLIYDQQHYSKSPEDSVAMVLKAGMDMNCGGYLANHTKSAIKKGKVTESDVDRALVNTFSVRMRLGLFNGNPSARLYGNVTRNQICSQEHQELALEAARDGIVLLKNSANLLPLSSTETKSLAVIGPNANDSQVLVGNYAGPPCQNMTVFEGLWSYVEQTKFHQGCNAINCTSYPSNEVVQLAKSADYVVLVMGLNQEREREECDRMDLVLPGQQQSLVMDVAKAAKKPVILVLLCGGPVDISFAKNESKIGAILWAGYPGEAGGQAIAEVIFGDQNPGGRLPMTWYPKDYIKLNMTDMRMRADPSSGYPGRTYRFYKGEKVFEFGFGLSYSKYSYKIDSVSQSKLDFNPSSAGRYASVSAIGTKSCEKAKISVTVSVGNEGKVAGRHSVLLFVRDDQGEQLVGFQKTRLNADDKTNVEFAVNPCEQFSRANEDGEMVIQSGDYQLVVGDQEYPITVRLGGLEKKEDENAKKSEIKEL